MNYIRRIKDKVHIEYVERICRIGSELYNDITERTKTIDYFLDKEKFNLGCFIKSEESITRKILKDLTTMHNKFLEQETYDLIDASFENEIKEMQDIFRMNFELDVENFEEELALVIEKLLENNRDLAYSGIFDNSFKSDKIGFKVFKIHFIYQSYFFEVQFHTKESNLLNKKTHRIYEVFRSMEPCDERESLKLDRNLLFKDLLIPHFDENKIIEKVRGYYE